MICFAVLVGADLVHRMRSMGSAGPGRQRVATLVARPHWRDSTSLTELRDARPASVFDSGGPTAIITARPTYKAGAAGGMVLA
jgi:hypothetical protein